MVDFFKKCYRLISLKLVHSHWNNLDGSIVLQVRGNPWVKCPFKQCGTKRRKEVYKLSSTPEKKLGGQSLRMMDAAASYHRGPNTSFLTGRMNELTELNFLISAVVHTLYMLYYCYYLIKISAASNFIVFNYCFIVCLHAEASELRCSSASKWNSFLSAFPD